MSEILALLNNDFIPLWGIVYFLVFALYIFMDRQLIKKDLDHIKLLLSNHITGTDKKIDKLDSKMDKLDAKVENNINRLDSKIDKLDAKVENNINRLDSKIDSNINRLDSKIDKMDSKMESNFNQVRADLKELLKQKAM